MNGLTLVGLSGESGSGKDTIAELYMRPHGFIPVGFADEVKIAVVATGKATWEEVFITKPPHVRRLMQIVGTEEGRDVYGEDYWVRKLFARLRTNVLRFGSQFTRYVITDARFPNEVEAIRQHGHVIRLLAPTRVAGNGLTEEQRAHRSERALDGYTAYDGYLNNDPENERTVGAALNFMLRDFNLVHPVHFRRTSPTAGVGSAA